MGYLVDQFLLLGAQLPSLRTAALTYVAIWLALASFHHITHKRFLHPWWSFNSIVPRMFSPDSPLPFVSRITDFSIHSITLFPFVFTRDLSERITKTGKKSRLWVHEAIHFDQQLTLCVGGVDPELWRHAILTPLCLCWFAAGPCSSTHCTSRAGCRI
jgi:hypothetical protein